MRCARPCLVRPGGNGHYECYLHDTRFDSSEGPILSCIIVVVIIERAGVALTGDEAFRTTWLRSSFHI